MNVVHPAWLAGLRNVLAGLVLLAPLAAGAEPADPARTALYRLDPRAAAMLQLQPYLRVTTSETTDGTQLTLVNVNPRVGEWLLLYRRLPNQPPAVIHVENPLGARQNLILDETGLSVAGDGERQRCSLRLADGRDLFAAFDRPIVPFCGGHLFVRTQQRGYRTTEETVVSLLRSLGHVGEAIINLYKETVGQDAELERAQVAPRAQPFSPGTPDGRLVEPGVPRNADVVPAHAQSVFSASQLGIAVHATGGPVRSMLRPGAWYPAELHPGIYVSLIAPAHIAEAIFERDATRVSPLDATETGALVYLLAFDLEMYRWRFHLGTDHPGVEWSPRPPVARQPAPGPDGFASVRPFARVGMVPPQERPGLAAVIVGGFKREHGAFRYGALSQTNNGSHYGFAESGVMLSRLQPGLATLFGRIDGSTELRVWSERDLAELPQLDWARQNGVPLIEADPVTGRPTPGAFVRSWGLGNWSGALVISTDPEGHQVRSAELRSVRAGACLQTHGGHRFMIYAYFSAATPSAMVRVFQAYQCLQAMLLDMNSPELTYAALLQIRGEQIRVEHLNQAMAASEPARGRYRFLHANDNRDFFTVLRRAPPH
jgi:hypothetical protein